MSSLNYSLANSFAFIKSKLVALEFCLAYKKKSSSKCPILFHPIRSGHMRIDLC